ncbi:CatB-related O-acetyltransferase [Methylobacterium komagatae]|uniref:CatB-related O-acetyltransferase n=1 Tax=Methylobacterium komagatae TaxID=374425 RepID=A0ABW2BMJ6_9HYPH
MLVAVDFTSEFVAHLQGLGIGMVPKGIFPVDDTTEFEAPMNLFGVNTWGSPAKVGAFTYFGSNGDFYNAQIGRYCSVANGISVGCTQHPIDNLTSSPITYTEFVHFERHFRDSISGWERKLDRIDFEMRPETSVGNDVWIGLGAYLKDGISIGNGAIIGAHAVVTKDVPPFAVVAGSPARIIKYRFSEKIIERIEKLAWWDYNLYEAHADARQVSRSLDKLEEQISSGQLQPYPNNYVNIVGEYRKHLASAS